MIISRTPVRISFFGGGTDYPAWYRREGGAVLSTTIDKYTYLSCRYLPPFFDYHSRIAYSRIELVNSHEEIEHPSVRECLRFVHIDHGVAIQHEGDLPALTGMGSSSAFTVGLLHALYALKGLTPTKFQLANDAIHVEQDLIGENVGVQDQLAVAMGGFNWMGFEPDGHFDIRPVVLPLARMLDFESHLLLVFTGFQRYASDIAAKQIAVTPLKRHELTRMRAAVDEGLDVLRGSSDLATFGELLHESWLIKRSLTHEISTPTIDEIYAAARSAGAIGGKVLGAGGGGFLLLFVRPEDQPRVLDRLRGLTHVPFHMERSGSQLVVYQPDEPVEYPALREHRAAVRQSNGVASTNARPFATGIPPAAFVASKAGFG